MRSLQSSNIEEITESLLQRLLNASTRALVSSSTIIAGSFIWWHNIKQSWRAQTSAMKLFMLHIFLVNPTTQLPKPSLIKPPLAALPNIAFQDRSVLSFNHPCSSFSHLTSLSTIWLLCLGWEAQRKNSEACKVIILLRFRLTPLLVKTTWFHYFQINQKAKEKITFHGIPTAF